MYDDQRRMDRLTKWLDRRRIEIADSQVMSDNEAEYDAHSAHLSDLDYILEELSEINVIPD